MNSPAARSSSAAPTEIPTIVPVFSLGPEFPPSDDDDDDASSSGVEVMFTADSVKRLPLIPRRSPGDGFCWQPASRAIKTSIEY